VIPSGTTIAPEDREAWLAERRRGLGASDCAAAMGLSPYCTPLELYYRKLGELPEPEDTPAMRRGRKWEGDVLDQYEETTGILVRRQVFMRHPDHPWMTATCDGVGLDAIVERGPFPFDEVASIANILVEAKVVGWRAAREWGEDGTDDVPRHVLCQVHHQLAVTGAQRCDVAALIGGSDFRVYPIRRAEDKFYQHLMHRLWIFWCRVEGREPPPPTLPADAGHLARLWPGCEGEVELGADLLASAHQYEALGRDVAKLQACREKHRGLLLAALGNARAGVLPDGRRVRRSVVEIPEATVTRKARTEVRLYVPRGKEAEDGDGVEGQ
jgi:putative phage-type endonuclease